MALAMIDFELYDEEGKPDAETAKKLFTYVKEKQEQEDPESFGWFWSDRAGINDNCFSVEEVSAKSCWGFYDDLEEIGKNVLPAKMYVYLQEDYTDNGYPMKITIYCVEREKVSVIKDEMEIYLGDSMNFFTYELCDGILYPYGAGYKEFVPLVKSRKSGKTYKLMSWIEVKLSDDASWCYEDIYDALENDNYRITCNECTALDKDGKKATTLFQIAKFEGLELCEDDFRESREELLAAEGDENGHIDFSQFDFVEVTEDD